MSLRATQRARALALILPLALLLTGCGADEKETPVACLEGTEAYLGALADAPGEVRLDGEPISACLAPDQDGGELAGAGGAMVAAANQLNREARDDPDGPAPVRLGYLVGAAERGAERTEGIHTELLRRLEAAATYAPGDRPPSAAFERGYREGLAAGRDGG